MIKTAKSASNHITTYDYAPIQDPDARQLKSVVKPEGDKFTYLYDARGNLTRTTQFTKNGSSSRIVYQASYPTTCTNPLTCNQPEWTRDASGAQTDFTYDATHGGLETKLEPAGANGLRRKTWNEYASYDTGSGVIWRLSATHVCSIYANGSNNNCNTASDNVVRYTYWGKTFLPLTVTASNGTSSINAVTTYTYDSAGRPLSVSDPTGITKYFRYDTVGRPTWEISPNGIGGFIAKRTTYDNGDRVTQIDLGTIPTYTSTALTVSSSITYGYDAEGNRIRSSFLDQSSTKIAQRQFSYDQLNRQVCAVRRMNPAALDATSDACAIGAVGNFGPDRVTKTSYDLNSRPVKVVEGYGVLNNGAGLTSIEMNYTGNGQVQWRKDGKGNQTNYTYDGYDRLTNTVFPNGSQEITEYDTAGRVWKSTKRDSNVLTFGYDGANRLTSTSFSNNEPTITTTYDGVGRPTAVTQGTNTYSTDYDNLGRVWHAGMSGQQLTYGYDLSGRRTRMDWHDNGLYVTYEYNSAGAIQYIKENGSTTLATVGYDALGRKTSLTRSNGTTTTYGLDVGSRLLSLTQDLASTGQDLTLGFTYSPSSDIATRTANNASYDWTSTATGNRSYVSNNMNQYTSVAGGTVTHDGRGNLTQIGGNTYGYNLANMMTSAPGTTLTYDPAGRLRTIQGTLNATFVYDADTMVAEINNGSVQRRFVHMPGKDEPLVWYEGTGTGDKRWLHADERGSIIAVTNSSGASIATNKYDEYGVPGAANTGRFQYTGQIYLPGLNLYHYKARVYSPSLGRFMQTDPIGYGDGMNMYAYVRNNPVNGVDPMGLKCKANADQWDCKADDTDQKYFTKKDVDDFNKNYTKAVNILKSDPDKKFKVDVAGRTMTITAGAIADKLISATVSLRETRDQNVRADSIGGPLHEGTKEDNLTYYSGTISYDRTRQDGVSFDEATMRTVVHEGMHLLDEEAVFKRMYDNAPRYFNIMHQRPYNEAAIFFLGLNK